MPTKTLPPKPQERSLPSNKEAERALLGSILLDNACLDVALETITKEDLYSQGHQLTFEKMQALADKSRTIDLVTLSEELAKDGLLEKAGGIVYLSALTDGVPIGTTAALSEYCRIVKEKSILRRVISASNNVISRAFEGAEEPDALVELGQQEFFEIGEKRIQSSFESILQIFKSSFHKIDSLFDRKNLKGVETDFYDLDDMLGGLQPSELIIVAAIPGNGKTALALNIACNVSAKNKPVGMFSLEMSKESLLIRLLTSEGAIDSHKFRTGFSSKEDMKRIGLTLQRLSSSPLYINDRPAMTINQLRAQARRLKAEKKIELLIVDYLQLIKGTKSENRDQEIGTISRGLKGIAKELKIPVLTLCQLSRKADEGGKPQLSWLRESGNIESDADVVIFIISQQKKKEEQVYGEAIANTKELHIVKNRNGPSGVVELVWIPEYTAFKNAAHEET